MDDPAIDKISALAERVSALEARVNSMEKRVDEINSRISDLSSKTWGILSGIVISILIQILFFVLK